MKKSTSTLLFALLFLTTCLEAQVGGDAVFAFLRLPSSARVTALGGSAIAVNDGDPGIAISNPSLLREDMDKAITVNQQFLFDGIYTGFAGYVFKSQKLPLTFQGAIQYMQYGSFDLTDEQGNIQGEFKARELAIVAGAAYPLSERMSLGANLKFASSSLESYQSFGILADIGGTYWDPGHQFSASLVVKNVGAQVKAYYGDNFEPVPVDIQLGLTKRLKHLPFRFGIVVHSLHQWDMSYDSPLDDEETSQLFGEEPVEKSAFSSEVDNFFRHFIFNGEFLLGASENLRLRIGYNHQRKKELSVNTLRSLAGFSGGVGIKINKFYLDYGFGKYHIAGSAQHIGISTNINSFGKNGIVD